MSVVKKLSKTNKLNKYHLLGFSGSAWYEPVVHLKQKASWCFVLSMNVPAGEALHVFDVLT